MSAEIPRMTQTTTHTAAAEAAMMHSNFFFVIDRFLKADVSCITAPQAPQNLLPGSASAPQLGQYFGAAGPDDDATAGEPREPSNVCCAASAFGVSAAVRLSAPVTEP